MKKRGMIFLLGLCALSLCSCQSNSSSNTSANTSTSTDVDVVNASDASDSYKEITADFTLEGGTYLEEDGNVKITSGGTYTLSGVLNGSVIVNTSDEVKLIFNNLKIENDVLSPVVIEACDSINLNMADDSYNEIISLADDSTYDSAIYSASDLKLTGHGALYVKSNTLGIHTKKDLKAKNLTLKVNASKTALKGNDSITIESGNLILISSLANGMKTSNSDISKKGNQRGDITIEEGNVDIYSAKDGLDSSHDINIFESDSLNLNIYTSNYSEYSGEVESKGSDFYLSIPRNSSSYFALYLYDDEGNSTWVSLEKSSNEPFEQTLKGSTKGYPYFIIYEFDSQNYSETSYLSKSKGDTVSDSYNTYQIYSIKNGVISGSYTKNTTSNSTKLDYSSKGLKASNEVLINGGTIYIKSYDDSIHADYGTTLENEEIGLGNVVINGGTLYLNSNDDAIHADNNLTVKGGTVNVLTSYEGLEGSVVEIDDGTIIINASDDGINAASKIGISPKVIINGGSVDVSVSNGDVDGIDSNGDYIQTGGYVITKCATNDTSGNASGLDIDGTATFSGGTFILLGVSSANYKTSLYEIKAGSTSFGGGGGFNMRPGDRNNNQSSVTIPSGNYQIENTSISFTLNNSYTGLWIISDEFKLNSTYKITSDNYNKEFKIEDETTSLS